MLSAQDYDAEWPNGTAGSIARCPPTRSAISSNRSLIGSPAFRCGHAAVKDRVNAIALAPVEDFRRDSDLFGAGAQTAEAQIRFQAP